MIRSHERQAVPKASQPIADREPIRSMKPGLALAALGVVFGDIGTSVLYSLQTVFSMENHAVRPTPGDVMGIISMIFDLLVDPARGVRQIRHIRDAC